MADLFGDTIAPPAKKPRQRNTCGRSMAAGPGSCQHWWDLCPNDVAPCAMRLAAEVRPIPDDASAWARANAGTHFLAFAIVHADRYRSIAAAHLAWQSGVRA